MAYEDDDAPPEDGSTTVAEDVPQQDPRVARFKASLGGGAPKPPSPDLLETLAQGPQSMGRAQDPRVASFKASLAKPAATFPAMTPMAPAPTPTKVFDYQGAEPSPEPTERPAVPTGKQLRDAPQAALAATRQVPQAPQGFGGVPAALSDQVAPGQTAGVAQGPPAKPTGWDRVRNAADTFIGRFGAGMVADPLQASSEITEAISHAAATHGFVTDPADRNLPAASAAAARGATDQANASAPLWQTEDAPKRAAYRLGEQVKQIASRLYPEDRRLQDDFLTHTLPSLGATLAELGTWGAIGGGLGGALALGAGLGTAGVEGAAAVGHAAAVTASMAAHGAAQEYAQAIAAGQPEHAAASALLGAGPSLAYTVPWLRMLGRFAPELGPELVTSTTEALKSLALHGSAGALELGVASVVDQLGHNAVAKALYDHDRPLGEGVLQAGGAGGVLGFVTSALMHSAGMKLGYDANNELGWDSTPYTYTESRADEEPPAGAGAGAGPGAGPQPGAGGQQRQSAPPPASGPVDPYGVLGVGRDVSDAEINRVYRQRILDLAPHLHADDPVVQTQFQNLNVARDDIFRRRAGQGWRKPKAGESAPRARAEETAPEQAPAAEQPAEEPAQQQEAPEAIERPLMDRLGTKLGEPEAAPAPPESGLSVEQQRAQAEIKRRVAQARQAGQPVDADDLGRLYQELVAAEQAAGTRTEAPPEEQMPERASAGLPREQPTAERPSNEGQTKVEAEQQAPEAVGQSDTYFVSPKSIVMEPDRFQFKRELSVKPFQKWDEPTSGAVLVSRDPDDGQLKMLDGHGRLTNALRLDVPRLRVLEVPWTGEKALRAQAALINIRQDHGTAFDAAKLFRETGMSAEDLKQHGVPPSSKMARDGLALAQLHEGLFDQVASGKLPEARAVVFGRSGLTPAEQMGLYEKVKAEEKKRRRDLTNTEIGELARLAKDAPTVEMRQETLFGTDVEDQSAFVEKGLVSSWMRNRLSKQAKTFKGVSGEEQAEMIHEAGIGTVDPEIAKQMTTEARQVLEVYDKLSTRSGPVSDALNRAAREIKGGKSAPEAKARAYREIKAAVQSAFAGREEGGAGGSEARGGGAPEAPGSGARPAAQEEGPGLFVGEHAPEGQRVLEKGPEYGAKKKLPPLPERTADDEVAYLRSTGRDRDAKRANALERFMVGSKVRNVVFRGDSRVDQMGDRFKVGRTTSGRFYFTDDPEIASKYVEKPDAAHDGRVDYSGWFKVDVGERKPVPFTTAWHRLTTEQRARVEDVARRAVENDHGELVLGDKKEPLGPSGEPALPNGYVAYGRDRTENWLQVLKDGWLDSGALYNEEERFGQILDWAGLSHEYDSPWRVQGGVTPVYLAIRKPIDAEKPPADFVAAVRAAAARSRTPGKSGVDTWDKTSRSLREWLHTFEENVAEGSDLWATSIPEQVTKVAQRLGYDGVRHEGGVATNGKQHNVWIAFEPTQIKSALGNRGTFDPAKSSIIRESADLFGEPVPAQEKQGELLGTGGPQGLTAALEQARATVSSLEGKVARGDATASERTRLQEARALLRREEGKGLGAGEVRPADGAQEPEGEKPLDLFGELRDRNQGDLFRQPGPLKPSTPEDETLRFGSPAAANAARAEVRAYVASLRPENRAQAMKYDVPGTISLIGKKLPEGHGPLVREARALIAPFRNGRMEIQHFIGLDDDGFIKMHVAHTSGAPNYVVVSRGGPTTEGVARFAAEEFTQLKDAGATRVVPIHNHPSGNPKPSDDADVPISVIWKTTADVVGLRYEGSMVTDDDTSAVILHNERGVRHEIVPTPASAGESPWLTPKGPQVTGPESVVAAYKAVAPLPDDAAAVLHLDGRRNIIAVEPLTEAQVANLGEWLPKRQQELASADTVIVTGKGADRLRSEIIRQANAHGLQTDEGRHGVSGLLDVVSEAGPIHRASANASGELRTAGPRPLDEPPRVREGGSADRAATGADAAVREPAPSYGVTPPRTPGGPTKAVAAGRGSEGTADEVKAILRHRFAARARANDIAAAEIEKAVSQWEGPAARAEVGKAADKQRIVDHVDAIEHGQINQLPAKEQAGARAVRQTLDRLSAELAKRDMLKTFRQDYFGRIWRGEDQSSIGKIMGTIFGRRPLRGSQGFKKQRAYDYFAQGVAAGLTPLDWNPYAMELHKIAEMNKAIFAHDFLAELKDRGMVHHEPGRVPEGYARINDEAFTTYSKEPTGETVLRGHWVAPKEIADVINQYMAPSGIAGVGFLNAARAVNNTYNQIQLFGAYHVGFVSGDAIAGRIALALDRGLSAGGALLHGKPGEAAHHAGKAVASALSAPIAPALQAAKGNAVLKAWRTDPALLSPEMRELAAAVEKGGGRAETDARFRTQAGKNFRRALASQTPGGMLRAIGWSFPAGLEKLTAPVLTWYVPRVKLAAFADLARMDLEKLGPGADLVAQRKALQDAWRLVDERMGQVVYDNLFWNRTLKEAAQLGFRSVGWNWGSLSLGARAATGNRRAALHLFATALMVGTASAIYQYVRTGKRPETIKDLAYPRTGHFLPDGSEDRISWPTYIKDYYTWGTHPLATIGHKLSPTLNMMTEAWQNEDFYGNQIVDPDASFRDQLVQMGKYAAKTGTPLSGRALEQALSAKEEKGTDVGTMFGATPAPASVRRSKFQNFVADHQEHMAGGRTPDQADRSQREKDALDKLRTTGDTPQARQELEKTLSEPEMRRVLSMARRTPDGYRFQQLSLPDQLKAYEMATPDERALNDLERILRSPSLGRRIRDLDSEDLRAQVEAKLDQLFP